LERKGYTVWKNPDTGNPIDFNEGDPYSFKADDGTEVAVERTSVYIGYTTTNLVSEAITYFGFYGKDKPADEMEEDGYDYPKIDDVIQFNPYGDYTIEFQAAKVYGDTPLYSSGLAGRLRYANENSKIYGDLNGNYRNVPWVSLYYTKDIDMEQPLKTGIIVQNTNTLDNDKKNEYKPICDLRPYVDYKEANDPELFRKLLQCFTADDFNSYNAGENTPKIYLFVNCYNRGIGSAAASILEEVSPVSFLTGLAVGVGLTVAVMTFVMEKKIKKIERKES